MQDTAPAADAGPTPESLRRDRLSVLDGWASYLSREIQTHGIEARLLREFSAGLYDGMVEALGRQPVVLSEDLRELLSALSIEFAERGVSPSQTATFVFSLKHVLQERYGDGTPAMTSVHLLVDAMGLHSMDALITRREQIIRRQSQELLELSVPVVPLWEGVLSLPIIGTLDSVRAQAITEKLLFEIARTGSRYAILDISGVPTVDTQTAQHLAKTAGAARLMGAECIITGIRPAIAQVMVALGIDLSNIETRFSLAEGLRHCFTRMRLTVVPGA
ncbi:STAS domain-containing protein [Rhodospirillum centenum]|uniref:Sigma-B modulator protein n=1 Tax=Rhodospirillum centenum (strain ATCC 51521 / SW) TaxID=414684 RepID=B6IQQ7_RHOCS|nr:STAS domain-containing protein [Rhodospirillum centenum]ACI97793.1 sigma-B modulator protein [Rhodospirillum centenum SW]